MTTTLERTRVPVAPLSRRPFASLPEAALAVAGGGWLLIAVAREPFGLLGVVLVLAAYGGLAYGLRRGGTARRWSALAAGTLALTIGVGIGARWLAKAPVTLPAAGGLLSTLAAVVLLGWAAYALFRAARGWRRAWGGPVLLAVLLAVWSTFPALVAAVVPPTSLGSATPADYGLSYMDVSFTTVDDVRLSAWWVPGGNGAAIIVKHGSGSTRTAALAQGAALAEAGYGVLLMDARGHGDSDGVGMDWGWYGDLDTSAAVTWLGRLSDAIDPRRIGVLGLSMGGEEAIGAAAADPRIRAVVAEGVTARTAEDRDAILPAGPAGRVQRVLDQVMFGLADVLTETAPPPSLRAAARAARVPTLVIAGGDVPDEVTAARAVAAAAPDTVDVWVVPGAGHTAGLRTAPEAWKAHVLELFDTAFGPRGD